MAAIVHGMWTSTVIRHYVGNVATQGHPDCVLAYHVSCIGMVFPGDELIIKLRHISMRDGNIVVSIETTNSHGDKFLTGSAEVKQPTTVYVFMGQGSQEPGIGVDLDNSSPAARTVWDSADTHLLVSYSFSVTGIVRGNPKEKTIYSCGSKVKLSINSIWI